MYALDDHFRQSDAHPRKRLLAVISMRNYFGDQRIIMRGYKVIGIDVGVNANTWPPGHMETRNASWRGYEGDRILSVDAALDRMASQHDIFLAIPQLLAGSNTHLLLNDIDAGNHFSYRVLDLYPRVHFYEIELVFFIEKFKCTGAPVAELQARICTALANAISQTRLQLRGRRLFDDLLVPPLHRAISFPKEQCISMFVDKYLNFNVTGILQEFFEVDHGIAECGLRFGLGHLHGVDECSLGVHDPHSAATTPAGRLDDYRVTD